MNTTTAATAARVTIPTIRLWARNGVIAAIKQAGRWIIDETSLRYRIALGKVRTMTSDRYHVTTGTNRYGSPAFVVSRTDGNTDHRTATYLSKSDADLHAEFLNRTPADYRITKDHYHSRSFKQGYYWQIEGRRIGDPKKLDQTFDTDHEVEGNWPEGTRLVDMLVHFALQHAAGADERIAKKAESDTLATAEQAARDSRAACLDSLRQQKGDLATPRQVHYIMQLLAIRERSGDGGGFFLGPTDRAGVEQLSKAEASEYITSLKGDY